MNTRKARGLKRESTIADGLLTPSASFALHQPTVTPKRDYSLDLTLVNDYEGPTDETVQSEIHQPMGSDGTDTISAGTAAGDGLSVLGHDVNRLVNLIDKLRRIGLQSIDGALPELVLVGDQSAGKSSLMGAIAEINLPKKAAMCTRCPYNIKTSPALDWECTVSLQEDHIYAPNRRGPLWQPREGMITRLFKTIYNKSELEEVLSWAQVAILNPSTDLEHFIPGSRGHQGSFDEQVLEAQYSPNVVAVDIRGPGLPALSFYDLPGLFQDAGTSELQFLVKAFDDLTLKYIKHESAIIICTISMANDAALSKTKRLIRLNKAEHKCVGVLTMPDRMQAGEHVDYDGIFHKTAYILPRGYYVTKQPGPDCMLDTTAKDYHALARTEEERFFDESARWGPGGEWSEYRDRCGTSTIQKYLSKEFARQILKSLPDLTAKIDEQTREVEFKLANLPETPFDRVQHTVRQQLSRFSAQVQEIIGGKSTTSSFHHDWTRLCLQFVKAIEIMRPALSLRHPSDRRVRELPKDRDVINLDESDTESVSTQRGVKRRADVDDSPVPMSFATPVKRVKQENGMHPSSPSIVRLRDEEIGVFRQPYLERGRGAMSLSDIRQTIQRNSKAGRPGFVSPQVHEEYALQAISFWSAPLDTFLQHTFRLLREQVFSALEYTLSQHLHTELYRESVRHIEQFLATHEEHQKQVSHEFYKGEGRSLFTINNQLFDRFKAEAHEYLKRARHDARLNGFVDAHFKAKPNAEEERIARDREAFKKTITDDVLGPDPFAKELDVAAYIRGYYTTARTRFCDQVCANIHSRFFYVISEEINYFLETKFKLDEGGDAEAKCRALLEGDPEIAQQRTFLRNRKQQLLEFSKTLLELKHDTFADDHVASDRDGLDDASSSMSNGIEYRY